MEEVHLKTLAIQAIALAIVLAEIGCGGADRRPTSSGEPEIRPDTVFFADAHLEAAVRQALKMPTGPLTDAETAALTTLEAQGRSIKELEGIQQLKNLTILDLSDNLIKDITPLSALTQLTFLDLSENQIADITVLAKLSRLESLVLDANQVQDLTPLLGLRSLHNLEVSGNPLAPGSSETSMAALQAAGVKVVFRSFQETPPPPVSEKDFSLVFVGMVRDRYRDIFVVRTDGHEAVNITNKPAKYSNLALSRDGSKLAFVSDLDDILHQHTALYVMGINGDNVTALPKTAGDRYPVWSPDGSKLATINSGPRLEGDVRNSQISLLNVDGSDRIDLLNHPDWNVWDSSWSPSGSQIAFVRSFGYWPDLITSSLYLVDADGSGLTPLTADPQVNDSNPVWLPDGRRIAFTRCVARLPWTGDTPPPLDYPAPECDICMVDANSGAIVCLADGPENWTGPVWSPDGRKIAFLSDRTGLTDLYVMDADGSNVINLTQGQLARIGIGAWSPDGTRIAFPASQGSNLFDLYVIGADGSNLTNLTNQQPRVADLWVGWIPE